MNMVIKLVSCLQVDDEFVHNLISLFLKLLSYYVTYCPVLWMSLPLKLDIILGSEQAPKVTFKKPIGSVSVSGHKFVGCPMPCGVQITRMEHINVLSCNVEYLASRDATIVGSRNGHAPIFLWYSLNRKGYKGFQKEVQKCLRNAHYLKDRLRESGIGAMLNELSSTVVFERPRDEEFVRRWQLACEGNIAHVVVMPNVTIEKLDVFLNELVEK
ncbi:hypothetical protein CRYUN_Cryun35bG0078900 [Craigia yunnanensis]